MPEPDHIKRAVEDSLRRLRIRQVMAERLEMLPLNKQIGFFSDAFSQTPIAPSGRTRRY